MSIVLHTTLVGPTIHIFVRSDSTGATFAVREDNSAGANAIATLGRPLEGLRRLGLHGEAQFLESRAKDWRFLTMAELAAALQMEPEIVRTIPCLT